MSNYRFSGSSMFPPVVKNLLIINVLVFIAQMTFGANSDTVDNLFALHDVHSVFFRPYQLITYMFMHGGFNHLLGNMLGLWIFGSIVENYIGSKRFLQYYVICGLGAALLHLGILYIEMKPVYDSVMAMPKEFQAQIIEDPRYKINVPTVGASGAIFGCLAGVGYLIPNTMLYIYGIFPVKAKWLALGYGVLELFLAVQNSAGDTVAHFAHVGGAITGIIVLWIWKNKSNRRTF